MNIKLVKEREAPLLSRRRLNFEIEYSGSKTPSKADVKKTIASLQKVKEELVAVRHIYPRFGESKAKIIVHIYKTLQDMKKYEPRSKKGKKSETPVEKPAEEKVKENVNAKEESKEQKAE